MDDIHVHCTILICKKQEIDLGVRLRQASYCLIQVSSIVGGAIVKWCVQSNSQNQYILTLPGWLVCVSLVGWERGDVLDTLYMHPELHIHVNPYNEALSCKTLSTVPYLVSIWTYSTAATNWDELQAYMTGHVRMCTDSMRTPYLHNLTSRTNHVLMSCIADLNKRDSAKSYQA